MSLRFKKVGVVFVTLIVCGAILGWSFFLSFGKFEAISNQPFEIEGIGKQTIMCQKKCLTKVPIGEFNATFKSNGFKNINAKVEIRRLQTTQAVLDFEYKPVLIVSDIEPSNLPDSLNKNTNPAWDQYLQNMAHLKHLDNKAELILFKKAEEEEVKITTFYNFDNAEIFWGNTGEKLLIKNNNSFYLVDLEKKLKYSTDFESFAGVPKFSPEDKKVLYNRSIYNFADKTTVELSLDTDTIAWKDEITLFYVANTENATEFYEYNLETKNAKLIFTTEALLLKNLKMSQDQKELEFETEDKKYELRLVE